MLYTIDGENVNPIYDISGKAATAHDVNGNILPTGDGLFFSNLPVSLSVKSAVDESICKQEYIGGYIEIQPDSWDGSTPSTDAVSNCWGFPMSISAAGQQAIKSEMFNGNGKGIMYIRFPLGFAYRGYRNIDETTGLARNIGERWEGQNGALAAWFDSIALSGGGLAPEYWCPAPHWTTAGAYHGEDNTICAGGSYDQNVTLASIRNTDAVQYATQIEAFTDAMLDDLEYLHQNIAPVRMFGLMGEPTVTGVIYGKCAYDEQTYNDVLEVLYPKIRASEILSTWNGQPNEVKLHVASSNEWNPFDGVAKTFIKNHADWIWAYSQDSVTRDTSGEATPSAGYRSGADYYRQNHYLANVKGTRGNVFTCEYEYFSTSEVPPDEFRCSNNMLRLINEFVYGGATVLHPIIHICKPTGQTLAATNTTGYCIYAVSLDDGSYEPNTWAYNSWKMFNDNLPIGATVIGDYSKAITGAGWVTLTHGGKLYIFMANNSENNLAIYLTFDESKVFNGKVYSMDYLGEQVQATAGKTIKFVVPAYSGICWAEQ